MMMKEQKKLQSFQVKLSIEKKVFLIIKLCPIFYDNDNNFI